MMGAGSVIEAIKRSIKKVPLLRDVALGMFALWQRVTFRSSDQYWQDRYRRGGNSGSGSYGLLAQYKADVLNKFVAEKSITSVIELGCGDGNQLTLAKYPRYFGLDISRDAVRRCIYTFAGDDTKGFLCYVPDAFDNKCGMLNADLGISLDVVYHLIENGVYEKYLMDLFQVATKWVVIYTSAQAETSVLPHILHRDVVADVGRMCVGWKLVEKIENPNRYLKFAEEMTSFADFYVFQKS